MSRLTRSWRRLGLPIVIATLLVPGAALAQSSDIPFRPACQLADDAAASAALGVDVIGDDSLSNLSCSYLAGDATVAIAALTPGMPLDMARLAFPAATDLTIAGTPAIANPGDDAGTLPTVVVALPDGGILAVSVMPDAGLADPLASATALAEALLAAGPATATLPEEPTGPAIEFAGDPCTIVSLEEVGGIVGGTFTSAEPDGSGGCTYQTDMTTEMTVVGLTFTDGTLAALRSGSTSDLTVADRSAVFWPALGTLFVDAGSGRLFSVMLLAMAPAEEGGLERIEEQAAAIAELAVGRMTPAAG